MRLLQAAFAKSARLLFAAGNYIMMANKITLQKNICKIKVADGVRQIVGIYFFFFFKTNLKPCVIKP
jgi:hypothetical protein